MKVRFPPGAPALFNNSFKLTLVTEFHFRYNNPMNFSLKKPLEPIIYPPQVILASQSIGRKYLLEKLGIGFRIVVTGVDEDAIYDKDPMRTIRLRALAKAQEVVSHPH